MDFEIEILAACAGDEAFLRRAKRALGEDDPWTDDANAFLWGILQALRPGDRLTGALVAKEIEGIKDDGEADEVAARARKVWKTKPAAPGYLLDKLEEWLRTARMREAMIDASKKLAGGDVAEAELALARVKSGGAGGGDAADLGDWWGEFAGRMEQREAERDDPDLRPAIPTRIKTRS